MTDVGGIASAVADHGEARKTEDPMSQLSRVGSHDSGRSLGKGTEIRKCRVRW